MKVYVITFIFTPLSHEVAEVFLSKEKAEKSLENKSKVCQKIKKQHPRQFFTPHFEMTEMEITE